MILAEQDLPWWLIVLGLVVVFTVHALIFRGGGRQVRRPRRPLKRKA